MISVEIFDAETETSLSIVTGPAMRSGGPSASLRMTD